MAAASRPAGSSGPSFEPYMEFFAADISFGAAARRLARAAQRIGANPQWMVSISRHLDFVAVDSHDGGIQEQPPITGGGGEHRPLRSACPSPSPALQSPASESMEHDTVDLDMDGGASEVGKAEAREAERLRQKANVEFWKQNHHNLGSFEVLIPTGSASIGSSSPLATTSSASTPSTSNYVSTTPAPGPPAKAVVTLTPDGGPTSSILNVSAENSGPTSTGANGYNGPASVRKKSKICEMCGALEKGNMRYGYVTKTKRVCRRCYYTEYKAAREDKKLQSARA
ncbi:hypothetical protein OC846_002949 [Tilletia horrida]|uniref:Uncharacterized protein n=1 Tax=Tilletia horrida TaxID=155126 RepID=A0AAN6GW15_9BASI|nr:hypothetical protein OC846_002949 [Tilletia horrida]KAK0566868.1 hypothetical protein OC861_002990 [Tilletia horrida]